MYVATDITKVGTTLMHVFFSVKQQILLCVSARVVYTNYIVHVNDSVMVTKSFASTPTSVHDSSESSL